MSEMRELILEMLERILKDYCTKELIDETEKGKWPEVLWNQLSNAGVFSVGVPERLNGSGGDYIDGFHILRLAGKYAVPLPISETLLSNWLLAQFGISSLYEPTTYCLNTEEKLKVHKSDNGYIVTGRVKRVPWARYAKRILALGEQENQTVFLTIPLEGAKIEFNYNLAGEPYDHVIFEKLNRPDITVLAVNESEVSKKIVYLSGLSKAAMMSGIMEQILDLTVRYTKEREQFGRPIHRQQAIQQYLAILAGETAAAITMTNKAIDRLEYEDSWLEIASAKLKANESAGVVSELAHQIHGAIGVTHEHRLHQLTRRLWSWREDGGNEKFWTEQLASQFLNYKDMTLWEILTKS